MKKICFATHNENKLVEIRKIFEGQYEVVGLNDIGCTEDIAETRDTIEGNSSQKAEYVWENYNISCFADDTGLEVFALNKEPGVFSARYAGPQRSDEDNIALLLKNLSDKPDRSAQFKTVITLLLDGETHQFEGIVKGTIREEKSGEKGFGYDPVFEPEGYSITFAEMEMAEKNKISHRGLAIQKLADFLQKL